MLVIEIVEFRKWYEGIKVLIVLGKKRLFVVYYYGICKIIYILKVRESFKVKNYWN